MGGGVGIGDDTRNSLFRSAGLAVVPLGKAHYPHCLVPYRGLKGIMCIILWLSVCEYSGLSL